MPETHARDELAGGAAGPLDTVATRRSLLRRSLLGIVGVGLAGALVACGDDEEPKVTGSGAEDVNETPGIGNESGIGTGGGSTETEEAPATPGS